MRLCRHDWHIHKTQHEKTLRWKLLIGDEKHFPVFSIVFFLVVFPLSMLLALAPVPALASVGITLALFIPLMFVFCYCMDYLYPEQHDLWSATDASCLKCDKIKFDYTKWEKKYNKKWELKRIKNAKKAEIKAEREVIRQKNKKNASTRYAKMLELYTKAS